MRSLRLVAAVTALAFAASAGAQPVDPLDEARALERTLEYERALVIVDREIARGAATSVERLVELHLLAGRLAAGLDHPDAAAAHFARVLALAPQTRLPEGTSPKLTEPFDAARAATVPLHIAIERAGDRVIAHVGPDPAAVFAGVRVQLAPVAGQPDAVVASGAAAVIPAGRVALRAAAVDEHGNVLVDASVEVAARPGPARVAYARPVYARPVYARWSTWAIAAAGALAAAGVCAWRFEVDQDRWNDLEAQGGRDYSQLAAIESHGRAWAIGADVGFGVGAAAGIAAVVWLAIRHRDVRPAIGADAVGFAVRF